MYNSASKTALSSLDPIGREAPRIACGAFRSTTIDSLHALTGESTLEKRREYISLRYNYKIRPHISNPAYYAVTNTEDELLFTNRRISKPLSMRVKDLIQKYNLINSPIISQVSYTRSSIDIPTPALPLIDVNFTMNTCPKSETSIIELNQTFLYISNFYINYVRCFTDGSKSVHGVAP